MMPWRRVKSTPSSPTHADLWSQLENVNGWIRHADAKLATLIAFVGVAGGGLYVTAQGRSPLWVLLIAAAAGCSLVVAGMLAFVGLLPRRRYTPSATQERIYYRAIANDYEGPDAYARAILTIGDELAPNLARQIHANSCVADRKFVLATGATVALLVALAMLVVVAAFRVLS